MGDQVAHRHQDQQQGCQQGPAHPGALGRAEEPEPGHRDEDPEDWEQAQSRVHDDAQHRSRGIQAGDVPGAGHLGRSQRTGLHSPFEDPGRLHVRPGEQQEQREADRDDGEDNHQPPFCGQASHSIGVADQHRAQRGRHRQPRHLQQACWPARSPDAPRRCEPRSGLRRSPPIHTSATTPKRSSVRAARLSGSTRQAQQPAAYAARNGSVHQEQSGNTGNSQIAHPTAQTAAMPPLTTSGRREARDGTPDAPTRRGVPPWEQTTAMPAEDPRSVEGLGRPKTGAGRVLRTGRDP